MNNRTINIGSEEIKNLIMIQVKRLAKIIRIEKQSTNKEAANDAAYFLKQIIFILEKEK